MCKVDWCDNKPCASGKGYCRRHYDEIRKYGHTTNHKNKMDRNDIAVYKDYAEIILRNDNLEEVGRAIVDIDMLEELLKYKWGLKDNGYARTTINHKTIHMHQVILKHSQNDGLEIDHINRNKLDNRRCNLRLTTHSKNMHNRDCNNGSICEIKDRILTKPFYTSICINNRKIHLGYFLTKEEAQEAINACIAEHDYW